MRILQICPRVPYPLHDGGAVVMFNVTKHIARRGHQINLVALGANENVAVEELRQYCNLSVVKNAAGSRRIRALLNIFSPIPYTVSKYHTDALFHKLSEIVERTAIDIVQVEFLHMAVYGLFLKERYKLPIILRGHNVDSTIMHRFARHQKNPLLRWFAHRQYKKLQRYESKLCEKFDCCVMITAEDEQRVRAISARARTAVIPAGVDLPATTRRLPEEAKSILFLARLDWRPNVDGFFWFYEHVLPLVLREEPDIRLSIVGRGRAARLEQLRHANIRFIGFVEDVVPYIQAAEVCIVPLLAGGGMRIKILEMFAHGKCVVSTAVGCEGLEVENGRELLVADEAVEFARSLLTALRQPHRRAELGNNARKLVETKYDWQQIGAAFERVYLQCLKQPRQEFSA